VAWPRVGRNGGWPAGIVLQDGVRFGGRTRSSWVREVMASLVKTLRKVVLDPARIDEPAGVDLRVRQAVAARRATWTSWAVSPSLASTGRLRALAPASSSRRRTLPGRIGLARIGRLRHDPPRSRKRTFRAISTSAAAAQTAAGSRSRRPAPRTLGDRLHGVLAWPARRTCTCRACTEWSRAAYCPAADRSRPLSGGQVVPDEPPALASCSRMPGSDIWKATHRSTASGRRLTCLGSHDIDIDLQCPRCRPRGRAHDRPRALRERRLTTIHITGPTHGGERLPTGDAAGRERGGRHEVVARRGDVSVVVRS
jgi:hypothetical protein